MYPVLLAHLTHVVSVAEDEVLFFLKRDERILGGAWQRKQKKASLSWAYTWDLLSTAPGWVCVETSSTLGQMLGLGSLLDSTTESESLPKRLWEAGPLRGACLPLRALLSPWTSQANGCAGRHIFPVSAVGAKWS